MEDGLTLKMDLHGRRTYMEIHYDIYVPYLQVALIKQCIIPYHIQFSENVVRLHVCGYKVKYNVLG